MSLYRCFYSSTARAYNVLKNWNEQNKHTQLEVSKSRHCRYFTLSKAHLDRT